jgi:tetratricopeptide (TPR) repeat protein
MLSLGLFAVVAVPGIPKSALAQAAADCAELPGKTNNDLWARAECYFKKGQNGPAIKDLQQISHADVHDVQASFTASWLLHVESKSLNGNAQKNRLADAIDELEWARKNNPKNWEVPTEIGDFYFLRTQEPDKAYAEYLKARALYDGDTEAQVPAASNGRRAAIEDRIARTAEKLDRRGEAVEASCRALFFDPDDKAAQERIKRMYGSCVRKGVKDPRQTTTSASRSDPNETERMHSQGSPK